MHNFNGCGLDIQGDNNRKEIKTSNYEKSGSKTGSLQDDRRTCETIGDVGLKEFDSVEEFK